MSAYFKRQMLTRHDGTVFSKTWMMQKSRRLAGIVGPGLTGARLLRLFALRRAADFLVDGLDQVLADALFHLAVDFVLDPLPFILIFLRHAQDFHLAGLADVFQR